MPEENGMIQIEYYHTYVLERNKANAWLAFRERIKGLKTEEKQWRTIVLDSVTNAELSARKTDEYNTNPDRKDTDKWGPYNASSRGLEEVLMLSFAGLNTNVVVICHVEERVVNMETEVLRAPMIRGLRLSKGAGAAYAEVYHSYAIPHPDDPDKTLRMLQTQTNGSFMAGTQIDAPNPCEPRYEALWENWPQERRINLHTLVYGDMGTGKTTFAATFPKPMLVLMFDPIGKDTPFIRLSRDSQTISMKIGNYEIPVQLLTV